MLKIKRSGNGRFCTIAGPEMNQQFIFKIDKLLSDNVKGCEYSQKYKLGLWDGKFHLFRWYEDSNVGYFPAGALPDVISLIKLHNYQLVLCRFVISCCAGINCIASNIQTLF